MKRFTAPLEEADPEEVNPPKRDVDDQQVHTEKRRVLPELSKVVKRSTRMVKERSPPIPSKEYDESTMENWEGECNYPSFTPGKNKGTIEKEKPIHVAYKRKMKKTDESVQQPKSGKKEAG